MKKNFLFYLSALLIFSSCESEHLYGPGGILIEDNCDTANLTYTNQIKPIFENNCLTPDCHTTETASGKIVLDNYDSVKVSINKGKVLKEINYEPGNSEMPPNGKMNNCTILQIETWIKEGMKE